MHALPVVNCYGYFGGFNPNPNPPVMTYLIILAFVKSTIRVYIDLYTRYQYYK